ncbi:MAG TPA: hypothetical protein VLG76_01415 [Rhabdochlamydiaceae bacterium]|nr:hypothetical protein [Rhabdochlamydiaceae bacterium]
MADLEKIVKGTDAVLNCIPIVNTINNAAQALYKLAHRVDVLNPVAPGLKTTIKVHILNKKYYDYLLAAIPIFGNLFALVELIQFILSGFKDDEDALLRAVIQNNTEVVHLCLGNNPLSDPVRADRILGLAAYSSNNETFKQVLYHRDDWTAQHLMHGLRNCWYESDDKIANANDILDFWTAHERVLDAGEIYSATSSIEDFLKKGRTALVGRVIGILPKEVPFYSLKDILRNYSCAQFAQRGDEVQAIGVLTTEQRNTLIGKTTKLSFELLKDYYFTVACQLKHDRLASDFREIHFDTLNRLLDLAGLQPKEIEEFIERTLAYDEFAFIEPLVAKYERHLTPQSKVKILDNLLPSHTNSAAFHEKRAQLFASWLNQWKDDVSAQAHKLYTEISESCKWNIESAQFRSQFSFIVEEHPTVAQLQTVNARFKQILLEAFPGCDQALEVAV